MIICVLVTMLILFAFSPINAASVPDNSVFKKISLTTAKEMAAEQGKHIFIEFYASWCVPCKWMEETTLADKEVQSCLNDNYIALRIDIDDFDGYAVKNQFGIKVLPTLLIIDQKGLTLERKEQSMSAAMLLNLLKSQKGKSIQAPVNSSPSKKIKNEIESDQPIILKALPQDNIANQATVETKAYRVQVGVFTDYANTQKLIDQLRTLTEQPIVVLNAYLNQKTVFKVLVGDFSDREMAGYFKNQLREKYGIDGYVK